MAGKKMVKLAVAMTQEQLEDVDRAAAEAGFNTRANYIRSLLGLPLRKPGRYPRGPEWRKAQSSSKKVWWEKHEIVKVADQTEE